MDQSTAETAYDALQAALICIIEEAHETATKRLPENRENLETLARQLVSAGQEIARLGGAMETIASRSKTDAD